MSGRVRRSWGAPPDLRARLGLRVPRLSDDASTANRGKITTRAEYEAMERGFCTSWNGANAGIKSVRAPTRGKGDVKDRCAWTTPHVLDERGQAVRMSLEDPWDVEEKREENGSAEQEEAEAREERVVVSDDDMDDASVEYSDDEREDERDVSFSRDHDGAPREGYSRMATLA